MATRTISTRIQLDGEQEFKRQMSSVNGELRNLKSEMALADATFKGQANTVDALTEKDRILRSEIEQQREKVRALEQALEDASSTYGDTSSKTDGYRQSLNRAKAELIKMNDELEDTDKYLKEAKDSADGCAKSIDEFGKEAKDSGSKLGGLQGILEQYGDKLKVLGVAGAAGVAVKGLKEVAGAIIEVEESTREYRQIMGTLEVSAQNAGYTAEQTAQTYERLHSVLGDTQTAATATANLQALQLEQSKLMELTDSAIGAWAKYGDSIPIDGLSEAINETIRVGQVTGTFADVLNWGAQEGETYGVKLREANEANQEWNDAVLDCKSAEDYFNLALQECETQSERVDLVLQAMSTQGLSDAAKSWIELNDDIVKANESQARMDEAMGRLGESLEPIASGLRNLGADAISWLADRIDDLTESWTRFWDSLNKTNGGLDTERGQRMAASRGYNGSHASGLSYVPYDGYIAELHEGEEVLTKMEAQARRALKSGVPNEQSVITSSDLQKISAATMNAIGSRLSTAGAGNQPMEFRFAIELDGQTLARKTYTYNKREANLRGGSLVEVSG